MTAMWTVEAVCTSVLLEPCLCRRHVLHAVRAVVAVHLMGDTETTSDVQTMPAEVQPADWLERTTATLVPHQVENRVVKRRGHWWGGHLSCRSESSKY